MFATAKQEKYGIPVSGRVDVSIAKKLKEEASTLGFSMSRMVHIALSEWANAEEERDYVNQLETENKQLKEKIEEWEKWHPLEVTRINNRWNTAIAKFIESLSESNRKRQSFMNSFGQIFKNV